MDISLIFNLLDSRIADLAFSGLLRALYQWSADGTPPPPSQYPRLENHTLVRAQDVKFPVLPGVADPRRIEVNHDPRLSLETRYKGREDTVPPDEACPGCEGEVVTA